ncbi:MAG: nucleotidyltransferase domain-containing protein [bacterium]
MERVSDKYREIARQYVDLLKMKLGEKLSSAVLYGSVARGEAGPDSDIDLLIVLDCSTSEKRNLEDAMEDILMDFEDSEYMRKFFDEGLSARIQDRVFTREEALRTRPFYLDISRDGEILYDRDDFFLQKMNSLRRRMRELGTLCIYLDDGKWYWVWKPDIKPGEVVEL